MTGFLYPTGMTDKDIITGFPCSTGMTVKSTATELPYLTKMTDKSDELDSHFYGNNNRLYY